MGKPQLIRSKHFSLHSLRESVFAAIAEDGGAAICNSGLIDLGGQLLVFDTFLTPQAAEDLRQTAIDTFGQAPQVVINSHYHNDHIWGNQVFVPGAQIISSSRTREQIAVEGAEEFHWYSANSAQQLESLRAQYQSTGGGHQEQLMWIGYYEGLVEAIPGLAVVMPTITFDRRLEIHGAQRSARLIEFEGAHTASDTILYLPQEGIAFVSDLLFTGCHPFLADGNPVQWLKALREISRLEADWVVPGHGPVGTMQDVRLLMEYIESCQETASLLVKQGNIDEENLKELQVPERFARWKLPRFYQSNIRFLCGQIKP